MSNNRKSTSPNTARLCQVVKGFAWFLVVGSFPVWLALFAAPFFPIPVAQRGMLAAAFAITGEIMFWSGGMILGSTVIARFRKPMVRSTKSYASKSVAVVGATGGLGKALVDAFVREGASVLALGRDITKLDALRAGRSSIINACIDIGSLAALEEFAANVPVMDSVIVAVGTDVRKPLSAQSQHDIASQLEVNLTAAILITKVFVNRVRDGGSIVILGGFGDGRLGLPYYSVDVATRAGISAFAQAMNRELRLEGRDVRICYACPAPADTVAERPYAALWRSMGTPVVAPDKVADFVLAATLMRKASAVMGWQNSFISFINGISPYLADVLGLTSAGLKLRNAFGGQVEKTGEEELLP